MCKAPKPPAPKEPDKPEFLRNVYLDAAVGQSGVVSKLRSGRSQFRIDLDAGLGIGTRQPGESLVPIAPPTPVTDIQTADQLPIGSRRREGEGGRRSLDR
jgi:hypothetical protein